MRWFFFPSTIYTEKQKQLNLDKNDQKLIKQGMKS